MVLSLRIDDNLSRDHSILMRVIRVTKVKGKLEAAIWKEDRSEAGSAMMQLEIVV